MHRLPAGERQEQGGDDADQQEDDPDDGVPAHQALRVAVDHQAGHRTEARGEAPERRVGGCGADRPAPADVVCHRVAHRDRLLESALRDLSSPADDDAAEHVVVVDAAELVADDAVLAGLVGLDAAGRSRSPARPGS